MEYAILKLDDSKFCTIPTGYSFWCSHLKQTTHIAYSFWLILYSVALNTKAKMISRLCTQVQFPKPQVSYTSDSLYPTFVVYLKTIHGPISFISFISYSWMDILFFKERFRTFPNLFYKDITFFFICQVLCKKYFLIVFIWTQNFLLFIES